MVHQGENFQPAIFVVLCLLRCIEGPERNGWRVAPGFVIVDVDVKDPTVYREYRDRAPATVTKHGGQYIVRGGTVTDIEPGWDFHRFVVLQFPSVAAAKNWYNSPEYQAILPIRLHSTRSRMSFVEGLDLTQGLPA